jgi:hypothetical protein
MHVSSIPNTRIWFVATVTVLALAIALTLASKPASAQTTDTGGVAVSANNAATITLDLDATTVPFGAVSPDGTGAGTTSTTTPGGRFYQVNSAVGAAVNSNASWQGNVKATANGGTSADMDLSQLTWSKTAMSSGAKGTSFSTTEDNTAFVGGTSQVAGEYTYDFNYGLDVLYVDDAGTFSTTATYSVSQS